MFQIAKKIGIITTTEVNRGRQTNTHQTRPAPTDRLTNIALRS